MKRSVTKVLSVVGGGGVYVIATEGEVMTTGGEGEEGSESV